MYPAYPPLPGEGPSPIRPAAAPAYPTNPFQAHAQYGPGPQQRPAQPGPSHGPVSHSLSLNGPALASAASAALSSYGSGSVSALRLQVPDTFRVDPPIPISAGLLSAAGTGTSTTGQAGTHDGGALQPPPSLEHEQALLSTPAPNFVADYFNNAQPSVWLEGSIAQFVDMGYTPLQASLGVAYSQEYKLADADVPDFASNLSEMIGLGFGPLLSAGALAMKKNDVKAATELCLSLPAQ